MYIMNKVWEIGRLTKEPEIRYISKKNGIWLIVIWHRITGKSKTKGREIWEKEKE